MVLEALVIQAPQSPLVHLIEEVQGEVLEEVIEDRSLLNLQVLEVVLEGARVLRHIQAVLPLLEVQEVLREGPNLVEVLPNTGRRLRREGTTSKALTGEVLEAQAYTEIRMIEALEILLDLEVLVKTHLHKVRERPEAHQRTKARTTYLHQVQDSRVLPSQVEGARTEVLEVQVVVEAVQNHENREAQEILEAQEVQEV